jgi:glycosyltransferase involved in cell wall biosynthesis
MRSSCAWVVVPALNEAATVRNVIRSIKSQGYEVVCVDDGSWDATAARARGAGAHVVRHPLNLGQGAALQTGIDFALEKGAEFILTFDADSQHSVDDLHRLLQALHEQGADFALGSRFLGDTVNLPRIRRWLLSAATLFTRISTGMAVTDAHNGIRAMTKRAAARLHLRQNRMAHASEIIAQIGNSGLRYVEVPVTITYSAHSLHKGQKLSGAFSILADLAAGKLQQ